MLQKDYGFLSKKICARKSMGNNKIKDMPKSMMQKEKNERKTMGT
jgi:hypothetical protein